MGRDDLHFRLRIPEELKSQVEMAAAENNRSMTAEIIDRLRKSFSDDQDMWDILNRFEELEPDLKSRLNELERKVDTLWSRPAPYDEDHHRD